MYRCNCLGLKDEDFHGVKDPMELFEGQDCCGGCEQQIRFCGRVVAEPTEGSGSEEL